MSIAQCGPFQTTDIFRHTAQYMGFDEICGLATVCQRWNVLSKDPFAWPRFFIEEGIPFVESVDGKPRDYKADFSMLYPMTVSLKMSAKLFGNVPGEIPRISVKCFKKCFQKDPFELGESMGRTFKIVVLPSIFVRTSCEEFPFVLDKEGNLKGPLKAGAWTGKTLEIPNKMGNLGVLCEYPLAGKENMSVFGIFNYGISQGCNASPEKITLFFMRTSIADETRDMEYPGQEGLVKTRGYEVAPCEVRAFFDAVCILTSGTCPDKSGILARTSNIFALHNGILQLVGDRNSQIIIGDFVPGHGAIVSFNSLKSKDTGVVPCISAEAPPPPTV